MKHYMIRRSGERAATLHNFSLSQIPRKLLLLLVLLLVLATHSFPQSRTSLAGEWRKDLRALVLNLVVFHRNLFFSVSPQEFFDSVTRLDRAIPSLSDPEIIVRMSELVALAGDAHTSLFLLDERTKFHRLPIRVRWFSDGLFVTGATPAFENTLACKITHVGGADIDTALQAVARVISHENSPWLLKTSEEYLLIPEILYALHLISRIDSASFTFQDASGISFQLDLPALAANAATTWTVAPDPALVPPPLYQMNPDLNYWYQYLENPKTIYIKYNRCQSDAANPIERFAEELGGFMEQHPVEKVILDLRDNGGGDSNVVKPLFSVLADYFAGHRLEPYNGIAIIGRGTFSSGLMAALDVRSGNGILIGEPTGGKPNSYGNIRHITLPNSRLTAAYSTKYFRQVSDDPPSLIPDIAMDTVSSDYFLGLDPFLEAALGVGPSGLNIPLLIHDVNQMPALEAAAVAGSYAAKPAKKD